MSPAVNASRRKRFFQYASSSVAAMWLFSLYTIVDGIFVAWGVGPDALAAVNLSAPFTALIFSVGLLFAVGASTVIAVALGQGDQKKANDYFNQNMVVTLAVSVAITVLTLANLDTVVRFLGATEATLAYTKEYVGVIAGFAVFFIVSYNLEVLVKVDGAPQLAAVSVACCALMNVALDYLFVMRLGWGVRGAAVATGLAQVTSAVILALYILLRGKKLAFGRFRFHLGVYRRILPVGLSDAVTELSNGIVIFLFNRTILAVIGEPGIVSYTVVSYVNTLVLMTMSGISQGIQPLVSFHHGQGDRASSHAFLRYGMVTAAICSGAAFAVSQLGAESIVGLFISREDASLFAYTVSALRMFSAVFLLMGFNVVAGGFFAAIERPSFSLSISLGRGLVLLAASLLALSHLFGASGIWFAPAVADVLCLGLTGFLACRYRRLSRAKKPSPKAADSDPAVLSDAS